MGSTVVFAEEGARAVERTNDATVDLCGAEVINGDDKRARSRGGVKIGVQHLAEVSNVLSSLQHRFNRRGSHRRQRARQRLGRRTTRLEQCVSSTHEAESFAPGGCAANACHGTGRWRLGRASLRVSGRLTAHGIMPASWVTLRYLQDALTQTRHAGESSKYGQEAAQIRVDAYKFSDHWKIYKRSK